MSQSFDFGPRAVTTLHLQYLVLTGEADDTTLLKSGKEEGTTIALPSTSSSSILLRMAFCTEFSTRSLIFAKYAESVLWA